MKIGQNFTEFAQQTPRPDGAVQQRDDVDDRKACRCRHDESRRSEGAEAWRNEETATRQPGRRHVRRSLMHLARDIRHQVRDEIRDLRVSGDADSEKIAAVKGAYRDFRSSLKDVFHTAGRGRDFDPASIPDGVAEAMRSFTEALQVINGTVPEDEQTVTPPRGDEEAAVPPVFPDPEPTVPAAKDEVTAVEESAPASTASITIQIGIVIDFAA